MQMKHKGVTSSKHLLKNFLLADTDKSGFLNREEFESLLNKSGIFLSRMDITYLMRFFDKNKDGKISFNEFYETLVPELNNRRLGIVKQVWDVLSGGQGTVKVEDLYRSYNSANHPQVASGEKSEREILDRVLKVFEAERKGPEGSINEMEFVKAHREMSASFPIDDDGFIWMIECVWGVKEHKESTSQDLNSLETLIKEKIRLRMNTTETEEKALVKVFKFIDLDNKTYLNPLEFSSALQRIGVNLSSQQLQILFEKYDTDRSGTIDYYEFSKSVGRNNSHLFTKSTSHNFYS
jgi:Ca2+-binding EF-hand superfamily protein